MFRLKKKPNRLKQKKLLKHDVYAFIGNLALHLALFYDDHTRVFITSFLLFLVTVDAFELRLGKINTRHLNDF